MMSGRVVDVNDEGGAHVEGAVNDHDHGCVRLLFECLELLR